MTPTDQDLSPASPAAAEHARQLAARLATSPLHSPGFRAASAEALALGTAAERSLARQGAGTWPPESNQALGSTLAELRRLLGRLNPPAPPGPLARLLGRRERQPAVDSGALPELSAHIGTQLHRLYAGQDALRRHSAVLRAEEARLGSALGEVTEALQTAQELERLLTASLPDLAARQPLHASAVEHEVLFLLRQRITDLTVTAATTRHALLAYQATREQNRQLTDALDHAAQGAVQALQLARELAQRTQAQAALEQVRQAGQQAAQASDPGELRRALASAYAALDELQRLGRG